MRKEILIVHNYFLYIFFNMLNCLITDANIRIFGNAIAALARIGHDITFDVSTTSVRKFFFQKEDRKKYNP